MCQDGYNVGYFTMVSGSFLIILKPLVVNLYFCNLLFGLSGTVISIKPKVKRGSMFLLNERESPFIPTAEKISFLDRLLPLNDCNTANCVPLNSTRCFSWCFSWSVIMSNRAERVNSINTPESLAFLASSIAS